MRSPEMHSVVRFSNVSVRARRAASRFQPREPPSRPQSKQIACEQHSQGWSQDSRCENGLRGRQRRSPVELQLRFQDSGKRRAVWEVPLSRTVGPWNAFNSSKWWKSPLLRGLFPLRLISAHACVCVCMFDCV